jgi:hypothetical protein
MCKIRVMIWSVGIDLDYRFLCYYLLLWNIMYEIIDFWALTSLAKPKLKVWNADIKIALKEKRNSYNIWLKNGKPNDPTNHLLLQKKHSKKEFRRAVRIEVARQALFPEHIWAADVSNLFQSIKKPVRTLSIFKSMAFVKDAKGISFNYKGVNSLASIFLSRRVKLIVTSERLNI